MASSDGLIEASAQADNIRFVEESIVRGGTSPPYVGSF